MTAVKQVACFKAAVRQHQTTCRPDEIWTMATHTWLHQTSRDGDWTQAPTCMRLRDTTARSHVATWISFLVVWSPSELSSRETCEFVSRHDIVLCFVSCCTAAGLSLNCSSHLTLPSTVSFVSRHDIVLCFVSCCTAAGLSLNCSSHPTLPSTVSFAQSRVFLLTSMESLSRSDMFYCCLCLCVMLACYVLQSSRLCLLSWFLTVSVASDYVFLCLYSLCCTGRIMFFLVCRSFCFVIHLVPNTFLSLRKNTERILMKFAGGNHYHEQINWLHLARNLEQDRTENLSQRQSVMPQCQTDADA